MELGEPLVCMLIRLDAKFQPQSPSGCTEMQSHPEKYANFSKIAVSPVAASSFKHINPPQDGLQWKKCVGFMHVY